MNPFAALINAIVDLMIVMLAMRMFIEDREARVNNLFNMIFRFTEPLVKLVKAKKPQWGRKRGSITFLPMIPIMMLILFRGILFGLTGEVGLITGVLISIRSFLDLVLLVYAVLILTFTLFYRPGMGPQSALFKVGFRMVRPLFAIMGQMSAFMKQNVGVFSFLAISLLHVALCTMMLLQVELMSGKVPNILYLLLISTQRSGFVLLGLATFYMWAVIIGALMSWINPDPQNPIVQAIHFISEPINRPVRKYIPTMGGIDFTPLVTIIGLSLIRQIGEQVLWKL